MAILAHPGCPAQEDTTALQFAAKPVDSGQHQSPYLAYDRSKNEEVTTLPRCPTADTLRILLVRVSCHELYRALAVDEPTEWLWLFCKSWKFTKRKYWGPQKSADKTASSTSDQ